MAEKIFTILLYSPLIIILIISVIYPEVVATWGYSIKYKGEAEPTDGYINYLRYASLVALLFIATFILGSFSYILGLISLIITLAVMFYLIVIKN